jgi:hypothetical protein
MRYPSYRETLALYEKGVVRPDQGRGGNGKDTLRWGIVITAIGLALSVGPYPIGLMPGFQFPLGRGPWMITHLSAIFKCRRRIMNRLVFKPFPHLLPNSWRSHSWSHAVSQSNRGGDCL